jgi:hypothetical protein
MTHLRWDGYRVVSHGVYQGGGEFVSYGYLCGARSNKDSDRHVAIFFVPGVGYQYKE